MDRELAIELLREMAFTATESYRQALETAINALSADVRENRTSEDLISRERLINEWDDLGRRYAMPTTPIHKRAFREFPSADMRGKSCNTCKNNDDDEISGECYECIKGIFDHYEPQESEE